METRLEVRLREPNPLFTRWLERWLREAERRQQRSQHKLRQALEALKSYPLPLYCGRDCAVLRGFGGTLCQLIDEELRQHRGATAETQPAAAATAQYEQQVQQVVKAVQEKQLQKAKKCPAKKPTKKAQLEQAAAEERERVVEMLPGSFEVLLLVDTQETSGKNKRVLDQTRSYLQSLGAEHEVRRLTVGDFLWIARDADGNELVLPYIVERKRMDDLASSIRDGRFHEQKHRLRQCGLPHVIYLIEDYGDNEQLGLPLDSLLQALANARIQSGIQVVRTENHYRSMCYLAGMGRALHQLFLSKSLHSVDRAALGVPSASCLTDRRMGLLKFRALYEDSAKNAQLTVREVFVQQLLQLHSLSMDRALAIVERYPTPRLLLDAYASCGEQEQARRLLAGLTCGALERPLGEKLSQCLYDFYGSEFR
ncbi:crossover junction endonuclease MUS81 [Drosophila guanche]|uniref:Crossover junction endonuclease MUS81 n=1 Tax=Drosophila guanche TaxID=7266 RepID=A0A3B0K8X5_DROGU|nr:crossover junction endonuclease MUS81 [Drosophila guanche]SPP89122.1 blast:Crossover junction endonuclease MUS81 [Drosophila guanche]